MLVLLTVKKCNYGTFTIKKQKIGQCVGVSVTCCLLHSHMLHSLILLLLYHNVIRATRRDAPVLDWADNRHNAVKELAEEISQPLSSKNPSPVNEEPAMSCFDPGDNSITCYDSKMANKQKEENLQSMSEIEAELEAELERLGINMDPERTSGFREVSMHPRI